MSAFLGTSEENTKPLSFVTNVVADPAAEIADAEQPTFHWLV